MSLNIDLNRLIPREKENVLNQLELLDLSFLASKEFDRIDKIIQNYKTKIRQTVTSNGYIEYWELIAQTGQLRKSQNHLKIVTLVINSMWYEGCIYLKYAQYSKETGKLLGYFDMQKLYRGISIGGKTYKYQDIIQSLVVTRNKGDRIVNS